MHLIFPFHNSFQLPQLCAVVLPLSQHDWFVSTIFSTTDDVTFVFSFCLARIFTVRTINCQYSENDTFPPRIQTYILSLNSNVHYSLVCRVLWIQSWLWIPSMITNIFCDYKYWQGSNTNVYQIGEWPDWLAYNLNLFVVYERFNKAIA